MSFLSRRIDSNKEKEKDRELQQRAEIEGKLYEEAEPAAPAKPAPKSAAPAVPAAEGKQLGTMTEAETLSTGYVVPPKLKTTPRVMQLRKQLRAKLLAVPDEADRWTRSDGEKQKIILERLNMVLQKMNVQLGREEYEELKEKLLDDLLGFGAIQPLVVDRGYSEIMVNGNDVIFAEYKGKLRETEFTFDDEEHVQWTAQRIVRPLQRDLSRRNPMVDGRLPDGSRVHIITQPSALNGTTITIRKFPEKRLTVPDLVKFGSFDQNVAEFFEAAVVSRLNIVVSGGTGSGKTTLLNVLSNFIPEDERVITVEDSAELQLAQRHVVRLETAPPIPGGDGKEGALTIRDLVKGTLRMRPDRIVVGEIRDGSALDMLQAMNTGHDGSLTTVHSNNPRECIGRLETLCLMAGMDLPLLVIRKQIAGAVNLIVQQARLKDGSRKVVQITEVQGMEGDSVVMQDIFVYWQEGQTSGAYSHAGGGKLTSTGFRPKFIEKFEEHGFKLSAKIFGVGQKQFK
jgi:pilus assembly protein CpaF